jgi:hypothetical protein
MVGGLSREIESLLRQSSDTTLGLRDTVAALAEAGQFKDHPLSFSDCSK